MKNIPIDFITTHAYSSVEQYEYKNGSPYAPRDYFSKKFRDICNTVRSSPMPDLEIHWTEWNTISVKSGDLISFLT